MLVSEIFISIQGESTYAGLPCIFVRLAGCNLSCTWCDTPYAREMYDAKEMSVDEIIAEVGKSPFRLVEITGGEPLEQMETRELSKRLLDDGYNVLIETNGTVSLKGLDERIVKIVDVKCPSSGHGGNFLVENIPLINESDEVKFVIADREDYEYARKFLAEVLKDRTSKILFAPVRPDLDPKVLAGWILQDGLKVRLQLQLHRYIWDDERGR